MLPIQMLQSVSLGPTTLATKPRDLTGMGLRVHPKGHGQPPHDVPYSRHACGPYG
jgi:hypothetical protein